MILEEMEPTDAFKSRRASETEFFGISTVYGLE